MSMRNVGENEGGSENEEVIEGEMEMWKCGKGVVGSV